MAAAVQARGLPIDGMIVTGEDGVSVQSRYPDALQGRALVRRDLDWALIEQATAAGAEFAPATTVRQAVCDDQQGPMVRGVRVDGRAASSCTMHARVVIAADGRRSTLAFGLGVARHPPHPRRWAIGAYFENVSRLSAFGEMHVRPGAYIGVAPIPGGLGNVCLVRRWNGPGEAFGDPAALLRGALTSDPVLRARFEGARMVTRPMVLGPLAVDVRPHAVDGLLLAGDAAGFIDPMTGDGMRFAVRGGELAALSALQALEHGWNGVHAALARQRRREFGAKWRFNRTLRALVSSRTALRVGRAVAVVAPSALGLLVRRAGDCDLQP
jgi:flavin-dependent dehydrogenase